MICAQGLTPQNYERKKVEGYTSLRKVISFWHILSGHARHFNSLLISEFSKLLYQKTDQHEIHHILRTNSATSLLDPSKCLQEASSNSNLP